MSPPARKPSRPDGARRRAQTGTSGPPRLRAGPAVEVAGQTGHDGDEGRAPRTRKRRIRTPSARHRVRRPHRAITTTPRSRLASPRCPRPRTRPPALLLLLLHLHLHNRPLPACRRPTSGLPRITPGLPCQIYLAGRGRAVQREAVDGPSSKAQAWCGISGRRWGGGMVRSMANPQQRTAWR
jgi:hypothetical protein